MSFANVATKQQLADMYDQWSGVSAQFTEMVAAKAAPEYMVLVSRWVGGKVRHVKRNEYLFSTLEIAQACMKYWRARGGIVKLALLKIEDEYGYTQDDSYTGF